MSDSTNRPEKLAVWTKNEVSLILEIYHANIDKIGFGKRFKNKIKLFGFIAQQLKLNFGSLRTARNVADKFKNMKNSQKNKSRLAVKIKPKGPDDASEAERLYEELPSMEDLVIELLPIDQYPNDQKYMRWSDIELEVLKRHYDANIRNVGSGKLYSTKTKLYNYISEQMRIELGTIKSAQNIADKVKNINYYYKHKRPLENTDALFPSPNALPDDIEEISIDEEMDTLLEPKIEPDHDNVVGENLAGADPDHMDISDFEWPDPNENAQRVIWTDNEVKFITKLYFANVNDVGDGLQFKSKAKFYTYIAQQLFTIGGIKTPDNVRNKFKSMIKHGLLNDPASQQNQSSDGTQFIEKEDEFVGNEVSDMELNDGSAKRRSHIFWTNEEWRLAKSLYDEHLPQVGPKLLYQTKIQMFAYIAQELQAIGSNKTTSNVYNKFKNMRKKGQLYDPNDSNLNSTPGKQTQDNNDESADSESDDFECPEAGANKKGFSHWTHDEWRFALKLYAENLPQVGPGLPYQNKAQMYAYIAKKLVAIGSDKTAVQVSYKFKNMRNSLQHNQLSDGSASTETILQKYENLRNWDDDEVSFLLSTYNANANNIGAGKKYTTKMQLWTYVAAQLNANFKSNKTASNVAKKFQNITKAKSEVSDDAWSPEETTFMLTLYLESKDDFEDRFELFEFIAEELLKNFSRTVTAEKVQQKYNDVTAKGKAIYGTTDDPAYSDYESMVDVVEEIPKPEQPFKDRIWSEEETNMVLSLYTENAANIGMNRMYKTKRDFWKYVAQELTMQLNSTKTPEQVAIKFKNMWYAEHPDGKKQKDQEQVNLPIKFHEKYNRLLWSEAEEAELEVLYKLHCGEVGPSLRFRNKESLWVYIAGQLSKKFGVKKTPRNAFVKYKSMLAQKADNPEPIVVEDNDSSSWTLHEEQFLIDARRKIKATFKPRPDQMWNLVATSLNKFFKNNRTTDECNDKYMELMQIQSEDPDDIPYETIVVESPVKQLKSISINVCSLCMADKDCVDIFTQEDKDLPEKIFEVTGVRFKKTNTRPIGACPTCLKELKLSVAFRLKVQTSFANSCNSIDIVETDSLRSATVKPEARLSCDKCGATFQLKQNLVKHLTTVCSIRCAKCSKHFLNESFLENHMKTTHGDLNRIAKPKFSDVRPVEIDPFMDCGAPTGPPALELTAETEHKCEECACMFGSDIKLMAHKILKHNKTLPTYPCEQCKPVRTFINRGHLEAHKKTYHISGKSKK